MRTIALVLLMLTFLAAAVMPAQEAPKLKPEDISSRVDKVFAKWDNYNSPGCAVGVYRDGRTVYLHGYGMADLDHDARIEPSTVFHVASMSKQFTAASVEMLSLEGKLSLDDPARKYIPELARFWRSHHHSPTYSPHQRTTRPVGLAGNCRLAIFP